MSSRKKRKVTFWFIIPSGAVSFKSIEGLRYFRSM